MREPFAKNLALYFVAWTLFALYFFSESYTKAVFWTSVPSVRQLLVSWLAQAYAWAFLTPVVLWLGRRFPFAESRRAVDGLVHVVLSGLCAFVAAMVVCTIAPRPSFGVPQGSMFRVRPLYDMLTTSTGFHQNLFAYWIVFGVQFVSIYYEKYRERERQASQLEIDEAALRMQLVDAELSGLRRQLQPELVSDTLDRTAALVRAHQYRRAEDLLTALGDLMRSALDDVNARMVPLDHELEHVRTYLALEQLRLDDRVRLRIVAEPATLDAAIMPASIGPIVKNALELIVDRLRADGGIVIRTARVCDMLKVEIECAASRGNAEVVSIDVGEILERLRAILQRLYGELFRLRAVDRDGTTTVTLLLPYQRLTHPAAPPLPSARFKAGTIAL